ncbi:uncharacterized protein LOC100369850 [Saccoglossus kowalevskii]|uniref:Uncharacterized protein LOC100369850 n=1 Tax=Saccoglossus kowalevskii TaxID=10224 RepID=A0ABM0LU60_SACKO|nr:PREDICTED: uncharacterized protein LOC100369850 [Saccoglossus kowalevskii]
MSWCITLRYLALTICVTVVVNKPLKPLTQYGEITLATYNIWNIMFNWDIRKYRIAEMIRDVNPDIIGFQEVRSDSWSGSWQGRNQLTELQELLPYHKWKAFVAVQHVKEYPGTVHGLGFSVEGLGLLSRHPILNTTTQHLTVTASSPDKNNRHVLHVNVLVPNIGAVHVAVVHLSYDRNQQCNNVLEIAQYLQDSHFPLSVIMGDFNIYQGFEQPLERLMKGYFTSSSGCPKNTFLEHIQDPSKTTLYKDAWKETHAHEDGFTFSNMPAPGMESRPDRILVSANDLMVKDVNILGDGQSYREQFIDRIWWNRLHTVINSAYLSSIGIAGRSCSHDCGPHGSCRCGVCVSGGNKQSCHLPQCFECNNDVYRHMLLIIVVFAIFFIQFLYAVLQVLFILNKKNQQMMQSMGCNCCLCYPGLYTTSGGMHRSRWRLCRLLAKLWPLCRFPALFQIILSTVVMICLVIYASRSFSDMIDSINSILPEELYPSDHLMLTAKIVLQPDGPLIQVIS